MNLNQRIEAFSKLGDFLSQFTLAKCKKNSSSELNTLFFERFLTLIENAQVDNGWFTKENVLFAIENWSEALQIENLRKWTSVYSFPTDFETKTIAIITAGNIPLVGFHDFLSVLISGHKALVKQSSSETKLVPFFAEILGFLNPKFKENVEFTSGKLENFDAVIATGSNNTARYFEFYFGKYPNIIRKNRNSVAILTGTETTEELEKLGEDIFLYYGLGCRSVSKLFVPENYNFDLLFNALYKFNPIIELKKYENNYDYNKAVYLMSKFQFLDNGFVLLKEDKSYSSPIASVFYEKYTYFEQLQQKLTIDSELIQCVINGNNLVNFVKFGESQRPKLWNYADDVDTIDFLLKI